MAKKWNNKEVFNKTIDVYSKIGYQGFRELATHAAKEFIEHPAICSVMGVGYPFYGDHDIISRVKHTDEKDTLRATPDIDLWLVYESDEIPKNLEGPFWNRVRIDFSSTIGNEVKLWKKVENGLKKYNLVIGKNPEEVIDNLMKGDIHVDINPVPKELWEDLPYLFKDKDINKLGHLGRDILFTSIPLAHRDGYQHHVNVPLSLRENKILDELTNGKVDKNKLIHKLVTSHPYFSISSEHKGVMEHHKGIWINALDSLQRKGLVHEENGMLKLNDRGTKYHSDLLAKRREVRRKWGLR